MARTIFITGSNSGIGLATVKVFLKNGFNVVATARHPSASTDLVAIEKENQGKILLQSLDYLKPETFKPAMDAAIAKFGKVDILINNAGYGQMGALEVLSIEDYRRQFEVNVFGPIELTKLFVPHFVATADPATPPVIIYVGSGASHFGLPFMSAYMASKGALSLFAEALSYELAAIQPSPVTVKLVVPHGGVLSTNFSASSNSAPVQELLMGNPEMAARYGPFAGKAMTVLVSMTKTAMPVEWPAEKILEAATDGTKKLRYFVAQEHSGPMRRRMDGMREGEDPDAADDRYMTSMRALFE